MVRTSPMERLQETDAVAADDQKRGAVRQKRLRRLRCRIVSWLASLAAVCIWCPDDGRMRSMCLCLVWRASGLYGPVRKMLGSRAQQRRLRFENAGQRMEVPLASARRAAWL